MKKYLLILYLFIISTFGYADSTTSLGRLNIAWPDLGHSGGAALETHIHTGITSLSDNIMGRYNDDTNVANGGTLVLTHNFGVTLANLQCLAFTESGGTYTPITDYTNYPITQDSVNQVTLTNNSGGPLSLAIVCSMGTQNLTDLIVENLKLDGNTLSSTDTNGDIIFAPDGTGNVTCNNEFRLNGSTSGYIGFKSPAAPTSVTYTFPADGTGGYVLSTDGLGTLSWVAGAGDVTGPGSSTDNAITRFHLATGKIIQNSGVTIDDSNNITQPDATYLATDQVRAIDGDGLKLYDDGGNGIFVEDGGQVGIGEATPSGILHLKTAGDSAPNIYIERNKTTASAEGIGSLQFGDNTTAGRVHIDARAIDGTNTKINFFTENSGTVEQRMTIMNDGDVGIGVADPDNKLEVDGDIRITGSNMELVGYSGSVTISASYQTLFGIGSGIYNFIVQNNDSDLCAFTIYSAIESTVQFRYTHSGGANCSISETSEGVFQITGMGDSQTYDLQCTTGGANCQIKSPAATGTVRVSAMGTRSSDE